MESPPPSPPLVTRVAPEGPNVNVLVGKEQEFTPSCNQSTKLTFFLDGRSVYTSNPGVQEATLTCASAPLGQHVVRLVTSNWNRGDPLGLECVPV